MTPTPELLELADQEIGHLRDAYHALTKIVPGGRARAFDWLAARMASDNAQGLAAALSVQRFARRLAKRSRAQGGE